MKLTLTEIKGILDKRPNQSLIRVAKNMNKILSVHITGLGKDEYLSKIETFENSDQEKLRKRYARSNEDLFERVLRPLDKVFTARGSNVYYNLPTQLEKDFLEKL